MLVAMMTFRPPGGAGGGTAPLGSGGGVGDRRGESVDGSRGRGVSAPGSWGVDANEQNAYGEKNGKKLIGIDPKL